MVAIFYTQNAKNFKGLGTDFQQFCNTTDFLTETLQTSPTDGRPLFYIKSDAIVPTVFGADTGFTAGNIGGFAQASDDARAVIDFMHNHPVLAGYEAPVICEKPSAAFSDVSSKLQMPIEMPASTVREGTLTVTNLKGADATGSVTLTGIDTKGNSIPFVLDKDPGDAVNSDPSFTLAAGASQAWTVTFTGPKSGTTITWTATATADNDNNLTNNTAIATTTVMSARGQRGSGTGE